VCIYALVCVCVCVCVCARPSDIGSHVALYQYDVCMQGYTCIYVCVYMHMYIYEHAHTYTYIYTGV
jgi:hypothetical protein